MFRIAPDENSVPSFAAQKSIYYFEKLHPNTAAYHHTIISELVGDLNITLLAQAVQMLMQRHEMLQARIIEDGGQVYLGPVKKSDQTPSNSWPLEVIDLREKFKDRDVPEVQALGNTLIECNREDLITKSFALSREPLLALRFIAISQRKIAVPCSSTSHHCRCHI